jgi:hypothetical protein
LWLVPEFIGGHFVKKKNLEGQEPKYIGFTCNNKEALLNWLPLASQELLNLILTFLPLLTGDLGEGGGEGDQGRLGKTGPPGLLGSSFICLLLV